MAEFLASGPAYSSHARFSYRRYWICDWPGTAALPAYPLRQLQSETYDRAAYAACQNVSAVAHQLGYHGLVTPAATKMGETLVLFTDQLSAGEQPVGVSEETWFELPADPRKRRKGSHLRVVE